MPGKLSALASAYAVTPIGSMNSVLRISPGWTATIFLDLAMVNPFLVIICYFHVKGVSVPPEKAHAVLIVDSNAVLSHAVSAKRFQMISRGHLQVVECYRRIQNRQLLRTHGLRRGLHSQAASRLLRAIPFTFSVQA